MYLNKHFPSGIRAFHRPAGAQLHATLEAERTHMYDIVFKLRTLSGVAQNVAIEAKVTLQNRYKKSIRQEFKKSVKQLNATLLRISQKEHRITQDFDTDDYLDARSDSLTRIANPKALILENAIHLYFSRNGADEPALAATPTAALMKIAVVIGCMQMVVEEHPILPYFKSYILDALLPDLRLLYANLRSVAQHAINATKFKADRPHVKLGAEVGEFSFPEKNEEAKEINNAFTDYGLALVSGDSWAKMAEIERQEEGENAMMLNTPKPYKP